MRGIAVGVDAGGTATTASFSRDGVFCGTLSGEGASASALGISEAARRIVATIEALLKGESPGSIYVGAAGAGRSDVACGIERALRERFAGAHVGVSDDAHIALRACVQSGPGMVLIAGTGSIAYAISEENTPVRAGGYGYFLGDEGSGFALGLAATKVLARVYDGGATADELTAAVQTRLGVDDEMALLDRIYGNAPPVARIAALAPVVLSCANAGVRSAQKIVQTAALELCELLKRVAKKAGLRDSVCPLVLSGGLLGENSMLSFLVETRLQADLPLAGIIKGHAEAHRGALLIAQSVLENVKLEKERG